MEMASDISTAWAAPRIFHGEYLRNKYVVVESASDNTITRQVQCTYKKSRWMISIMEQRCSWSSSTHISIRRLHIELQRRTPHSYHRYIDLISWPTTEWAVEEGLRFGLNKMKIATAPYFCMIFLHATMVIFFCYV